METENDYAYKNAFREKYRENIDVNTLLNVITNDRKEIIEVNFNIIECEKIMLAIVDKMDKTTKNLTSDGYFMMVPLGYITKSPLLVNLGPKIPVKISTNDVVIGYVTTKITEFGINNALIEIYLNLEVKINTSLPINKNTKILHYTPLIASKIINGTVPNFYGGSFMRKSETFNLPISENM